jgi:hypothetical protein
MDRIEEQQKHRWKGGKRGSDSCFHMQLTTHELRMEKNLGKPILKHKKKKDLGKRS